MTSLQRAADAQPILDTASAGQPLPRQALHSKKPSETFASAAGQFLPPVAGIKQLRTSQPASSEQPPIDLLQELLLQADRDYEWDASPASPEPNEAAKQRRNSGRQATTSSEPRTGYVKKAPERRAPDFASRTRANAFDPAELDPKRAKRIVANRQSAFRSRLKKLQHVHSLEQVVTEAAAELQAKAQAAASVAERHAKLHEAAQGLQQQALALHLALASARTLQAALEVEIERLRYLYNMMLNASPQLPGTGASSRHSVGVVSRVASTGLADQIQSSVATLHPTPGLHAHGTEGSLSPSKHGEMPMSLGSVGMSISLGSASAAKLVDSLLGAGDFCLESGHSLGLDGAIFDFNTPDM